MAHQSSRQARRLPRENRPNEIRYQGNKKAPFSRGFFISVLRSHQAFDSVIQAIPVMPRRIARSLDVMIHSGKSAELLLLLT